MSINIGIAIIKTFALGRKFSLTDFKNIYNSLYSLSNNNQLIQQLFTELNVYQHTHSHTHTHTHTQQNQNIEIDRNEELEQQITRPRYINYQTRVIDLLRKSFSIKGSNSNQIKIYKDFINNEMAQFLASKQSVCRFLEVSIKIVIGKCTEDLKNSLFGQDLKDVIDAFGKLIVSCIKPIDLDYNNNDLGNENQLIMTKTFFNCVYNDIMNRIKQNHQIYLINDHIYV